MDDLISIREASAMLGLSRSTLRDWVWRKKIAHVRVGRAVRFKPSDVQALIEAGSVPASPRKRGSRQGK
jgi:excisionase family DNA binding protein